MYCATKSKGLKSGDLAGHSIVLLRPIHRPEKILFDNLIQSVEERRLVKTRHRGLAFLFDLPREINIIVRHNIITHQ